MGLHTFIASLGTDKGFWLLLDGVSPQTWSHRIESVPKVIGRDDKSQVVLVHERVSRRHAEIWHKDDEIYLRDLDSRNGTLIDGQPISIGRIQPSSQIQISKFKLHVVDLDEMRRSIAPRTCVSTQAGPDAEHSDETVAFFLQQKRAEIQQLTKAQIRVLRLLLSGASESEAAAELFLSPSTVHSHVAAIYKTLGVNSRGNLMAKFIDPKIAE